MIRPVDAEAARMLANLPDDLQDRGWMFVRHQSHIYDHTLGKDQYITVYVRPHEPGADPDHIIGGGIVNKHILVSTKTSRPTSWEEAYHHAVEHMRANDSKRKDATA